MNRAEFRKLVDRAEAVTSAIHERTVGLMRRQEQIVLAVNKLSSGTPFDRESGFANAGQQRATDADSFHFKP